jgi:hypothetical protein
MLCDFTRLNDNWICKDCGRKAKFNPEKYMPIAKCRIPENYKYNYSYIGNVKIKGVGDTLSSIIKQMGFGYPAISKTRARITKMNKLGIEWCENHQNIILQWIRDECILQGIQFLELPAKSIIRLAIRKAKNQNINI